MADPKKVDSPREVVWGVALSEDSETWEHTNSREEAIQRAQEMMVEERVDQAFIARAEWGDPWLSMSSGSELLDQMNDSATDNGCPDFIDEAFAFADGAEEALDKLLQEWCSKYAIANWWTVVRPFERIERAAPKAAEP